MFKPDDEESEFARYENDGGSAHDAGYDAYMTGLVFAATTKYIEIGDLLQAAQERIQ